MVIVSTILLHDMINRRVGITLWTYDLIILHRTMVSVISTLMLHVSYAVEVLVFMLAGGVRCHKSVVLPVSFIPGFSPCGYWV